MVAAVVRQALLDLRSEHEGVRQSAFWWLFVEERDTTFSLKWCCEYLEYSVRAVRLEAEEHNREVCWALAAWYASGFVGEACGNG